MKDGTPERMKQQLREFDERCRTLPEYAVYRTKAWLEKNGRYSSKDDSDTTS